MSKICNNCGSEMADAAVVCVTCGAAFKKPPKQKKNIKISDISIIKKLTPEKFKLFKKIGIIAGSVLAGALVIITVVSIILNNTGTKAIVKDIMNSIEEGDATVITRLYSEQYGEFLEKTTGGGVKDIEEITEDRLDTLIDHLEDETDSGFSVDYEIKDEKDTSERKVKSFNESFEKTVEDFNKYTDEENMIAFDKDAITEIKNISIKATATEDGEKERFKVYISLVKEKGVWRIWEVNWSY